MLFKKRKKHGRRANLRQPTPSNAVKEEGEEEEDTASIIDDVRAQQGERVRAKGVNVEHLAALPSAGAMGGASSRRGTGTVASLKSEREDLMGDQFAEGDDDNAEGNGTLKAHEALRRKFVDEQLDLAGLAPQEQRGEGSGAALDTRTARHDKLYDMGDDMGKLLKSAGGGEAGDIDGLGASGIAEVSLPTRFKIENIERTEAARRKQLAGKKRGGDKSGAPGRRARGEPRAVVGNVAKNFSKHSHDVAMGYRKRSEVRRQKNAAEGGGGGGGASVPSAGAPRDGSGGKRRGGQRPKYSERASDNMMVERFRKRQRHGGTSAVGHHR